MECTGTGGVEGVYGDDIAVGLTALSRLVIDRAYCTIVCTGDVSATSTCVAYTA